MEFKNFDVPTQVIFADEEGTWHAGIGYGTEIICGCCGGVHEIAEIYEYAPEWIQQPIHVYDHWVNIEDEIRGGELPESMIIEVNHE